jgi:hypothetical protein
MLKQAVDIVIIMTCKRHGNKLLYYWWIFQTCWLSLNHGSLARKVFGSLTIHFDRESTWSDIQEPFILVALWVYRIFLSSSQRSLTYYLIMAFKKVHLFASSTCWGQYALMLVMESVRRFYGAVKTIRSKKYWHIHIDDRLCTLWRSDYIKVRTHFFQFVQSKKNYSCTAWPLKMGPTGCPETSVNNYQSTLNNFPEEHASIGLCSRRRILLALRNPWRWDRQVVPKRQ